MKKKLLVSVLVIAIAVTAIAGGTLAWFTDAQSMPTNTLVAGVVSMDVNDTFPYEDNTFENAEPGTSVDKDVAITNDGTKREFLRAAFTETLTYTLHNDGTDLVKYLQDDAADGEADLYAAQLDGGNWEVMTDAIGNPVLFASQVGYSAIYLTTLGGYNPTAWTGSNNTSAPAYAPVLDEDTGLALLESVMYTAFRTLPQAQWYTVTDAVPNDAVIDQYDIYIDDTNLFANGLWTEVGGYWYFNQALYPAGYDTTPADGNDDPLFTATVAPFIDHVVFASGANDNLLMGSIYTIDADFETIQVTNGAAAASGWATFSADLNTNLAANVAGTWA